MAGFADAASGKFGNELKQLEDKIKRFEVFDIPLNSAKIIGEGSAAVVFCHRVRKKNVAVKKFRQNVSKKSLLKAADSIRRLRHRNIVHFRGYSLKPSCMLFEYCHVNLTEDLVVHNMKDLINNYNDFEYYNYGERLHYVKQICQGIQYLHTKEIIHRDIKPSNVLVDGPKENIVIKLGDFNEVSAFKETYLTTVTNVSKGMCFILDYVYVICLLRKSTFVDNKIQNSCVTRAR